jgi:hypothetical protein
MADAADSKSVGRKAVWVRLPPPAPALQVTRQEIHPSQGKGGHLAGRRDARESAKCSVASLVPQPPKNEKQVVGDRRVKKQDSIFARR